MSHYSWTCSKSHDQRLISMKSQKMKGDVINRMHVAIELLENL